MKKLLELEAKLRKAKAELEKSIAVATPPAGDDGNNKKPKKGHSSFTMDHINQVASTKDHKAAKALAHKAIDESNANDKNRANMKAMVNGSKSSTHLAQGMSNHLLAHPGEGLKVIKSLLGDMNPVQKMDGMDASAADVNTATKAEDDDEDEEKEDKKKDKKQIQKEIDKHNEKKHGEAKDDNSAMKGEAQDVEIDWGPKEMPTPEKPKDTPENESGDSYKELNFEKKHKDMIKFQKNGQWNLSKK